MTASRRELIGRGLAALAMTGAARAENSGQPRVLPPDPTPRAAALDTPALHGNSLAFSFKQPPTGLTVPEVNVERASGVRALKFEPGLTLLSLWAPWCAPCLRELADFAVQQRIYESKRFRILPVLTSPRRDIAFAEGRAVLEKAGAGALPTVIDRSPGSSTLFDTLARRGASMPSSLPCNLLVTDQGRLLGRSFGTPLWLNGVKLGPGEKPTPEMMAAARSSWVSPQGQALLSALQRGEIAGAA
ncbi:hypothetical protein CSW60_08130 [Caulobacter sp. X]|nr:hypothetical protein CSW60_08130 [Caulobacter sp. X]